MPCKGNSIYITLTPEASAYLRYRRSIDGSTPQMIIIKMLEEANKREPEDDRTSRQEE